MRVLVTGGTGTLGQELVPRLLLGHEVRVFSRQSLPNLPVGVQPAHGNVLDPTSVDRAMTGIEVVVHCATARRKWRAVEVTGTSNVVEAARRAHVDHVLYVSIVGVDRNPWPYYQAKLAAESIVAKGGVPWTILRSTQFHDFVDRTLHTAAQTPFVFPVPKKFRFQPISTTEAAERVATLVIGKPAGRAVDIGGPEVRTAADLARVWKEATGLGGRIVNVPVPGRTGRAFRQGTVLTPDHAEGRATWEQFLAYRYGA